jgi:hypothetical protein
MYIVFKIFIKELSSVDTVKIKKKTILILINGSCYLIRTNQTSCYLITNE